MAETTATKSITEKPIVGTLVSVGVALGVIFLAVWAAGKGWKSGTKAA